MCRNGGWAVCSWWTSSEAVQLWGKALGSPHELAACHHVPLLWHFRVGWHCGSRDQRTASGHGQDDAFVSSVYWRSVYLFLQKCVWNLHRGMCLGSHISLREWACRSWVFNSLKCLRMISLGPLQTSLQPRAWSHILEVYLWFPRWLR